MGENMYGYKGLFTIWKATDYGLYFYTQVVSKKLLKYYNIYIFVRAPHISNNIK